MVSLEPDAVKRMMWSIIAIAAIFIFGIGAAAVHLLWRF